MPALKQHSCSMPPETNIQAIEPHTINTPCPFCSRYKLYGNDTFHTFFDCPREENILANFYQSELFKLFETIALWNMQRERLLLNL